MCGMTHSNRNGLHAQHPVRVVMVNRITVTVSFLLHYDNIIDRASLQQS